MMGVYRIDPIKCGTLNSTKDSTTYLTDRDVTLTFPVYTFLLTSASDNDPTVLVDTGVKSEDDPFLQQWGREVGPPGGGPKPLLNGLADHGVTPEDIDYLVLTHLHHDHIANVSLFPDAELLLQRAELEEARDPLPPLARSFPSDCLADVEAADPTLLDGSYRLHTGIELLLTPGHSVGMQSVVVKTKDAAPYGLIGDLAYTRHNLDPTIDSLVDASGTRIETTPVDADYLPPGVHVDVHACYTSVRQVRERVGKDGVLLGNHDPEMADAYPN